jgi:glycerol-3-phosphate dehydrogenase (NAD(P)+)
MSGGTTTQTRESDSGTLAVIGAGCWGTTLASLQADNFSRVNLFTPEVDVCEEIARFHTNERYMDDLIVPANVMPTTVLEHALDRASMAIVAVPSHAVRAVAADFKGLFADRLPVVLATKGLEKNTGLLSLEVWRQETGPATKRGGRDPMVLSGPNLAAEIYRGMPAVSMVAGHNASMVARAVDALTHPLLTLESHHDPLGAQAAGALKNVYAVGCGMAHGLGWGDNVIATLVWRGLEETARFVEKVGGDPAVMMTPAGVGDFVATCNSPLSRNHDLGRIIACRSQGSEEVRGVREGAQTAQEALRRCRALGLELRLLETVWSVMSGLERPRAIIEAACGARRRADAAGMRNRAGQAEPWSGGLGLRPEMGVASE